MADELVEVDAPEIDDEGKGDVMDALTPQQQTAIVALLKEPTIPRAAEAAGIAVRTLNRWLRKPDFGRAYRLARRDAFGQAVSLAQHYAPLAVNTLAQVMADRTTPHHARVTAAATLLRFGREGIELDDLADRIEHLEKLIAEAGITR